MRLHNCVSHFIFLLHLLLVTSIFCLHFLAFSALDLFQLLVIPTPYLHLYKPSAALTSIQITQTHHIESDVLVWGCCSVLMQSGKLKT